MREIKRKLLKRLKAGSWRIAIGSITAFNYLNAAASIRLFHLQPNLRASMALIVFLFFNVSGMMMFPFITKKVVLRFFQRFALNFKEVKDSDIKRKTTPKKTERDS